MKFLKCVIIRTFGKLCTLDKGLRKNSFETKLRKKKTVQEIFGFLENSPPKCNLFVIGEFPRTVFFLRWLYFRAVAGSYFVPAVAEKIPFQIQMKNVISQRTDTISLGKHCGEPGIRALFIVKRQTLLYKTLQRYLVRKRIHIPEKVVSPY